MSKMIKINERFKRNQELGENDIYRKFSDQFDNLFNAEEVARNKEEFEQLYVNDHDFEYQVERFRRASSHMVKFCVGYTGIGKTTSLRHCFGLGVGNEVYIDKENKALIFPTFLDGYRVNDITRFNLSNRVSAVCSYLEEEYNDLLELMRTEEGKSEFYDFIRRHVPHILENVSPVEQMDLDEHEKIRKKLNGAYENDPFEFQASRLKFYIKKKSHLLKNFIIILDDIETLPEEWQERTIQDFIRLQRIMKETDYSDEYEYYVKLIISVRPHTYRILNKAQKSRPIQISESAIMKRTVVDLDLFFQRRFDYYTKESCRNIGNIETWKECYCRLMDMNKAFDGQYKEMIQALCFLNVREALASYSRVFANRFWVQKNKPKESIFSINTSEYKFNNINVIRALACKEEQVYWGEDDTIIPNIFYTTEEEDLSIYCLLVLKYFWRKRGYAEYGINAENIENVRKEWVEIFGTNITSKFIKAMRFLFSKKVLRKSIKDFDDMKTLDQLESLKDESMLYISPRGNEMYEMFSRDSVLLEMLRESAWRDYENRNYSEKTSSELMLESKQIDIFKDLLEYIGYLCEMEQDVLATVKLLGKGEEYKKAFSDEPVVQELLMGVKNSMDYSGIILQEDMYQRYQKIREKVSETAKKIR